MRQTAKLLCCLLLAATTLHVTPVAAQSLAKTPIQTSAPTTKTPAKSSPSTTSVEQEFERLSKEIAAETSDVIAVVTTAMSFD